MRRAIEAATPAELSVDAARRYDHMQQHSAQHLLSALVRREWGAATLSWALTPDVNFIGAFRGSVGGASLPIIVRSKKPVLTPPSPVCFVQFPADPTSSELDAQEWNDECQARLESIANEFIRSAVPVNFLEFDPADPDALPEGVKGRNVDERIDKVLSFTSWGAALHQTNV